MLSCSSSSTALRSRESHLGMAILMGITGRRHGFFILGLLLWVVAGGSRAAVLEPVALQLHDRSSPILQAPQLSSDDWQWLREKGELVLGVAAPSSAPMEIICGEDCYEGITADVLGALGRQLHVPVKVVRYGDRAAVLAALAAGDIDLVGSANLFEEQARGVRLTVRYLDSSPMLYVRSGELRTMPSGLDDMRIAMAQDYLSMDALRQRFPRAKVMTFASGEQALAELAFGDADVYLGDAVSSNYLVNLRYFSYVSLYKGLPAADLGFSFALRPDAARLQGILDVALNQVRERHEAELLKRWSGGGASVSVARAALSQAEQRWLQQNPVVRFVVSNDTAPLSYFDAQGRFSGTTADLLKAITARSGLRFELVRVARLEGQIRALQDGEADVSMLVPTLQREHALRFSGGLTQTTYGIVTRVGGPAITGAEQLRGKRIALPAEHALRDTLAAADYQFVEAETVAAAMQMVASGKVDATVALLPMAQYYVATLHGGQLKVAGMLENTPARLAFAVRKEDAELAGIIDKAMRQIPPDEVDIFQNRWRPRADVGSASWTDYRSLIYRFAALGLGILLLLASWNLHVRTQNRKRLAAEHALGDQLTFMESLINGTPHPIYVRDREGRLLTCNANYLDAFGTTSEAVTGRTALEGVKIDRGEGAGFHDDYMWVMANGKPLEVDRVLHVPGRTLNIYHWIHPYRDAQGEVRGVICGWIDVSDRWQLNEELRSALDAADQSSRAKTTFLATMSHEIRTPMSAVIGMLELALKNADHGRLDRGAIEVAYDSAQGLLELIGDILDVVRIESGHVSLSPRRANIREQVESVARVFDGLARQKSLSLDLRMDAAVNCDVLVDPMRLKQILSNLVGNAIKFTDSGSIRIDVEGDVSDGVHLRVRIKVVDTGIGIQQTEVDRLFEPFMQVDQERSARGGTGLGLPICKFLCELMGGSIAVSSVLGKGTVVCLDLPFSMLPELPASEQYQVRKALQHPRFKVLVVDDQPANRALLEQQLRFFDQEVVCAANGEEGLLEWRQGGVDVVITDCSMPMMNGYDMARAIRREEQRQGLPRAVIVGFTANAQPEERERCQLAGMDDCLFKPVSLSTLSQLLLGMPVARQHKQMQASPLGLDVEAILAELTGGDAQVRKALVAEARRSYQADLRELDRLLVVADPEDLGNLFHRIKGGARIFGAQPVVEACERAEALCRQQPFPRDAAVFAATAVAEALQSLVGQLPIHGQLPAGND